MSAAFNPLDMPNLAESIGNAILSSEPTPLADVTRFEGAGIYAIYYTGGFAPYALIGGANRDGRFRQPIYVGKAVPKGGRRGIAVSTRTTALYGRINEHRQSITFAYNLDIRDFYVRWLVVEPIWVPLGETLLITRYQPLWNAIIDGFGNHDPGNGRRVGVNSRWDTLHPGRAWAALGTPRQETAEEIGADASEYVRGRIELLGTEAYGLGHLGVPIPPSDALIGDDILDDNGDL